MINLIPAIDVIEGQCVRLTQGDFATKKSYGADPLEIALRFEDAGLTRVHLVDLDGARLGKVINYKILERIAHRTQLAIDFGGGIRSDHDLEIAFECGASQVNIGSIAAENRELFEQWLTQRGPERIILGADAKEEKVSVSGWTAEKELDIVEYIKSYCERGVIYVTCTDIAKDGLLKGPNFELYRKIKDMVEGVSLIASGGVTTLSDIAALEDLGVFGVIIGKALYEGTIKLQELKSFL